MKTRRHAKILEIINNHPVETQEELQALLGEEGYRVTQATVSRDIKELRLIKTPGQGGGYRYTTAKGGNEPISAKFHSIFAGSVVRVQYAQNIVVVHCLPGMAQAACAAMDSLHWDQVIGTLAGDDTFICVVTSERAAEDLVLELKKMLGAGER
ncbi:MAG: arginine repressor [Clostridia bacterium]|nr:arginine repressor [Clostridia bacterium]